MKYLINSDSVSNALLGKQQIKADTKYRLFKFCCVKRIEDNVVIFNNLTKRMLELTLEEAEFLNNLPTDNVSGLEELVENWFLVPAENDDCLLVDQIFAINKSCIKDDFIQSFIIYTTSDCNARCFYCFEHGVKKINMDFKTANDVADYMIKKSNGKEVKIGWFGGEPLYNSAVIDIICDKLAESGVEYSAYMVSNTYLFDDKIVKTAKENWHIKHVQTTLDGTEENYNKIKAYIYKSDKSPFKIVTDNIERLLKNDIAVSIRLNISETNYDDLFKLVDFISQRYSEYSNLDVYASNLYDYNRLEDDNERLLKNEKLFKLEDYIYSKGLKTFRFNYWLKLKRGCMAQDSTAVCISPIGQLSKCEHYSEGNMIFGSIYDEKVNMDVINYWKEFKRVPECKDCVLYPSCYGIYNCPASSQQCTHIERTVKLRNFEKGFENKYFEFKKNNNA